MEDNIKELTEFDALICDSRMQMLKALIPFAPAREQRFLSVYIKFMELSKTMELIKKSSEASVGICSFNSGNQKIDPTEILQLLRKHCSEKERGTIDMIMNMLNIYQTFQMLKNIPDDSGENGMNDILKGMLSPEQQEMFETYSSIL